MSVQTGRMVSADEAREVLGDAERGEWTWHVNALAPDLAHTVVVQAEQIAALRSALAESYDQGYAAGFSAGQGFGL